MAKLIHDNGKLMTEGGDLIHASDPSLCVCCGEPFDGECCLFANGATHCVMSDASDTVGEDCEECHTTALPTSAPSDPTNGARNVWVPDGTLFTYDMSSGNWSVNVKACPIWQDPLTSRIYWPPVPNVAPADYGNVITTTTAANAVLTSITVTKPGCTLQSNWRGCDRHYNCTELKVKFEGTSTPPTCTNCPACYCDDAEDPSCWNESTQKWAFSGYKTPFSGPGIGGPWDSNEDPCGADPWAIGNWNFGITENCSLDPVNGVLLAVSCESCP